MSWLCSDFTETITSPNIDAWIKSLYADTQCPDPWVVPVSKRGECSLWMLATRKFNMLSLLKSKLRFIGLLKDTSLYNLPTFHQTVHYFALLNDHFLPVSTERIVKRQWYCLGYDKYNLFSFWLRYCRTKELS